MARRSKYGPSIEYSGPLFTKDVRQTIRGNARDLMLAIAQDGERMVKAELTPGNGRLTGQYADAVEGRAKSIKGKKWAVTAVITSTRHLQMPGYKGYGLFLETGIKGTTQTGFRGLWIYRRVANALRRGSKVARADLVEGLN
jgi:hypothetical protein